MSDCWTKQLFKTNYNCEICANICPAHISHPLEILEDGTWEYHLKVYDTPSYYREDKMFCSANCCAVWHKKEC